MTNQIRKFLDKRTSRKLLKRLESIPKTSWPYHYHNLNRWLITPEFIDLIPKSFKPSKRAAELFDLVFKRIEQVYSQKQLYLFQGEYYTEDRYEYFHKTLIKQQDPTIFFTREEMFQTIKFWEDDVFQKLQSLNIMKPKNYQD